MKQFLYQWNSVYKKKFLPASRFIIKKWNKQLICFTWAFYPGNLSWAQIMFCSHENIFTLFAPLLYLYLLYYHYYHKSQLSCCQCKFTISYPKIWSSLLCSASSSSSPSLYYQRILQQLPSWHPQAFHSWSSSASDATWRDLSAELK